MTRFIFYCAVLTNPGVYSYTPIDLAQLLEWVDRRDWTSTIPLRYRETAQALTLLTGRDIPLCTDGTRTLMRAGDEALVFRLTSHMPTLPLQKKEMAQWIIKHVEIMILRRDE